MYDPALGRFVSPDSIVSGAASGAGGGATTLGVDGSSQLTPLTVDFHEPGFVAKLNGETAFRQQKGFWFQLSNEDKRKAKAVTYLHGNRPAPVSATNAGGESAG
jgi:hypothetical protein